MFPFLCLDSISTKLRQKKKNTLLPLRLSGFLSGQIHERKIKLLVISFSIDFVLTKVGREESGTLYGGQKEEL